MAGTAPRRARSTVAPAAARAITAVQALHRDGFWLCVVFAVAMLAAFWPSYYSRLDGQPSLYFHAHGVALTAWVGLLVTQAWLMRTGRRATHRRLGTLSYVAAPAVVIATVQFAHFRIQ